MTTERKRRTRASGRGGSVDAVTFVHRLLGGPPGFGDLIEAIREGEGMSQTEFAALLGVSKSHLCDIEKGRKAVSPERAARFAELLGYSTENFVRLSLQDAIDRAGLRYTVQVKAA